MMYKLCYIIRFAVNIPIVQKQEVLENYSLFDWEPMYVFKFGFYAHTGETIHLKMHLATLSWAS